MLKFIYSVNLKKITQKACNNFPAWFTCCIFMIPAASVAIIFQSILPDKIGQKTASFVCLLLFLSLVVTPLFLSPTTECEEIKKATRRKSKPKPTSI